jgi:hypothetical protein
MAVQDKGANLIRPANNNSPNVTTTCLELEFYKAFTMPIYLSPLRVAIWTISLRSKELNGNDSPQVTERWKPLSCGLTGVWTDKSKDPLLSVWGASLTYETICHVVEERLGDASTHSTYYWEHTFRITSRTRPWTLNWKFWKAVLCSSFSRWLVKCTFHNNKTVICRLEEVMTMN